MHQLIPLAFIIIQYICLLQRVFSVAAFPKMTIKQQILPCTLNRGSGALALAFASIIMEACEKKGVTIMEKPIDVDTRVVNIQKDMHSDSFEQLVKDYHPFIVSTISKRLDRYVRCENDPTYSIALGAFYKAVQKYEIDQGHFLNYARTAMDHALINHMKREEKDHESLDEIEVADPVQAFDERIALREEILAFEQELLKFGFTFDDLVDDGPQHEDTRNNAKAIAMATQKEKAFVRHLFTKRRLPVSPMCRRFNISRKVIYGSYNYIIAVIVVLEMKYDQIREWI